MQGYQLTFLSEQDKRHHHEPVIDWIMQYAKANGAQGGTVFRASEGFGADGHFHSAGFMDIANQPMGVTFMVSEALCRTLMQGIKAEGVDVVYSIMPVYFGRLQDYGGELPKPYSPLAGC